MAQTTSRPTSHWHPHLVGPVVLSTLGVLLLMTNLGALRSGTWRSLWQFWPVLIILLGLELLLTGRASWLSAFLVALVLLLIVAMVSLVAWVPSVVDRSSGERVPTFETSFSQILQGARLSEVRIDHGAGRLSIGAGASEGVLAEGGLSSADQDLAQTYDVRDGVGSLTLGFQHHERWPWRLGENAIRNDLQVRLNRDVPLRRLEINTGAAETSLDLRELRVDQFDLNTGASSTRVWMPERGQVSATIDAGAASIVVEIPREMAASIRVEGGLTGVDVGSRFTTVRSEGIAGLASQREYRTSDYDTAEHRVDLRISAGAASVEVR